MMYNFEFYQDTSGFQDIIVIDRNKTVKDLIRLYFKKREKENLVVDNIQNTYFIYNGKKINYENNENKIWSFFKSETGAGTRIYVFHLDSSKNFKDFKIISLIKDNVYSSVYKAKIESDEYPNKFVAVKKIKKEQLKEDIKENKCIDEITEEDFKNEISKFNRELKLMQICHCENSVEVYDYFDTEKEFLIIMELCDSTLFKELAKTKGGFTAKKIKEILLQLNNVFKKMNENNVAHRDIKLNNILIKYLNKNKTEFKVLLSDYGVSNQLETMTMKYKTNAGTKIFMAPEILRGKEYDNKCDLWSLGVNIFQLYTKKPPYNGNFESEILAKIDKLGQTVLNDIKDEKLKDLLSKLLESNPKKRISWEQYFEHKFFK